MMTRATACLIATMLGCAAPSMEREQSGILDGTYLSPDGNWLIIPGAYLQDEHTYDATAIMWPLGRGNATYGADLTEQGRYSWVVLSE